MTTQLDVEREVHQPMFRDGYALIDFRAYFGKDIWDRLCSSVVTFLRSESFESQRQRFLRGDGDGKDFLIRLSPERGDVQGGIWKEVATHPLLTSMAKAYFMGGEPLLADCDLWHTEPMPEGRDRSFSQNWHVDLEAGRMSHRIFKAFLYFNDIDEGNGPIQLWKAGSSLEDNYEMSVTVKAGTMLLVDTGALLHRGGYCTEGPRTVGLWYYTNGTTMRVPPLVSGRLAKSGGGSY